MNAPEAGPVTVGLLLLEDGRMELPGAIRHPDTFPSRVTSIVPGADGSSVLGTAAAELTGAYVTTARSLVDREGADLLVADCGYAALYQDAVAAVAPAVLSSLLWVPVLARIFAAPLGVLTYDAVALDGERRRSAGWDNGLSVVVADVQGSAAWRAILDPPSGALDHASMRCDLLAIVERFTAVAGPSALVLECTAMFPFLADVRRACGLPVFDVTSLAGVIAAQLPVTATAEE